MHLRARNKLRDLAADAAFLGYHYDTARRRAQERGDFTHHITRPGSFIEGLPVETRLMLKHLRSEDFTHDKPLESVADISYHVKPSVYKIPGTCADRQG